MGAPYLGDFADQQTVHFMWDSSDSNGASITRSTDGTVSVYKDNGLTQTTVGVTDTEDFDSLTGIHVCTIATTDSFYVTGSNYTVVLSAATIDTQTVNAVLAHFSIENRKVILKAATHTGATVPTVTTLTGHTAQTGDSFTRLGAPAGADVSTDIADIPTVSEFNARTLLAADYFDSAGKRASEPTAMPPSVSDVPTRSAGAYSRLFPSKPTRNSDMKEGENTDVRPSAT